MNLILNNQLPVNWGCFYVLDYNFFGVIAITAFSLLFMLPVVWLQLVGVLVVFLRVGVKF